MRKVAMGKASWFWVIGATMLPFGILAGEGSIGGVAYRDICSSWCGRLFWQRRSSAVAIGSVPLVGMDAGSLIVLV